MNMKRDSIMKWNRILGALVVVGAFWACSDGDKTAGTSEEAEGITAISDKRITGVSQKGPFVKGSDVVLKETTSDGSLTPTGKEWTTKTLSDSGNFKIDSINLESQYVLLSVEGHYKREYTGRTSRCPMRLDAVSNLEKRETVNINLLTHFEYKRVLNLIKSGKTFVEAKKQAATEILDAFGVEIDVSSAEDLNIYKTSDADRTLFNISRIIDENPEWNYWYDDLPDDIIESVGGMDSEDEDDVDCSTLQKYIDGFSNDFADDGALSDTIMQYLAGEAYRSAIGWKHMEYEEGEKDDDEPGMLSVASLKRQYEFGELLFRHYMGFEACTEDFWGESRKFEKPIEILDNSDGKTKILKSGYFLCNGYYWELTTKEHLDSLKMKIAHETGTMTDPRDGKEYKTVRFEYEGKKYEWMAENLQYTDSSVSYTKGADKDDRLVGSYSWTTAMNVDSKYMKDTVGEDLLDSLHQGICPVGWHVATSGEWKALLDYVGNSNNLLNENWRGSDKEVIFGKNLIAVVYDKFDFNLMPMDTAYLETYYHTYTPGLSFVPIDVAKDADRYGFDNEYGIGVESFFTIEISINHGFAYMGIQGKGYVRCVKN